DSQVLSGRALVNSLRTANSRAEFRLRSCKNFAARMVSSNSSRFARTSFAWALSTVTSAAKESSSPLNWLTGTYKTAATKKIAIKADATREEDHRVETASDLSKLMPIPLCEFHATTSTIEGCSPQSRA